jgi:YggT family protein
MGKPLYILLSQLIFLFSVALVLSIVLHWLKHFNIINRNQPFVIRLSYFLHRLTEPALRPIRRYMPDLGGIDISPLLLLLLLQFLDGVLKQLLL